MSSATCEHVAVPERVGQKESPASRNEERTMNEPRSASKTYLKRRTVKPYKFLLDNHVFPFLIFLILMK